MLQHHMVLAGPYSPGAAGPGQVQGQNHKKAFLAYLWLVDDYIMLLRSVQGL